MIMELGYTEGRRDLVERRLAAEANKREINHRRSGNLEVFAYWLMKENVCTIFIIEGNLAGEFVVPNHEAQEWFTHPYAHPDAPRRLDELVD